VVRRCPKRSSRAVSRLRSGEPALPIVRQFEEKMGHKLVGHGTALSDTSSGAERQLKLQRAGRVIPLAEQQLAVDLK